VSSTKPDLAVVGAFAFAWGLQVLEFNRR
jgi:hypothetical protein